METNSKKFPRLSALPNGYLVFLILIPISGRIFFEPLIVLILNTIFNANPESVKNHWLLWTVFYSVLNGYTCNLDSKELKKHNIDIDKAIFWGAVFVPAYIYIRGSTLNKIYDLGGLKSQWAFITWIVLFIITISI
jgi:hypothetical protein